MFARSNKHLRGVDRDPIKPLRLRPLGQHYVQKTIELGAALAVGVFVLLVMPSFISIESITQEIRQQQLILGIDQDKAIQFSQYIHKILSPVHSSLNILISIMASLLALLASQSIIRIVNARQEKLLSEVYAADREVLSTLEIIAELSNKMTSVLQDHPNEAKKLFSKLWRNKTKDYLGYIRYLSDLDVDVESSAEIVFTRDLIKIAQESIWAIAVAEQRFWSEESEAENYFESQRLWLRSNSRGEIKRIFVLAENTGEFPEERVENITASKTMLEKHLEWAQAAKKSDDTTEIKTADRYQWRVISWRDWISVVKAREDTIIYDQKYVRRGPLLLETATEQRKAHFRSNDADVLKAIEHFEALWDRATPSQKFAPDGRFQTGREGNAIALNERAPTVTTADRLAMAPEGRELPPDIP